jgi:hypothetical protein
VDHISISEKLMPEDEEAREENEKDAMRCKQTFEAVLKRYDRKLHDARVMDQTLLRTFCYCDASWRDSTAAFARN